MIEEFHIRPCDIVHLLTASDEMRDEMLRHYVDDPISLQYFEYMKNAYEPEKRNYPALRSLLTVIQIMNRSTLLEAIESVVIHQEIDVDQVKFVYDLGAGRSKWWDILLQVFPYIESMYRVDKDMQMLRDPLNSIHIQNVQSTIEEFLASQKCGSGPEHLYFMSELLHCKQNNFQFLQHEKVSQSHIIVNELGPNPFIHYRLDMTGGGLMNPAQIKEWSGSLDWSVEQYVAYFEYYIMAKKA